MEINVTYYTEEFQLFLSIFVRLAFIILIAGALKTELVCSMAFVLF